MTQTNSIESETFPAAERWPDGGLEPVSFCPACGCPKRELLHEGLRDRVFFCAPGTWTLYRCKACGSGYLDPRPTTDTIGLAYRRYFTHFEGDLELQRFGRLRRLRRSIGNGYRNARFGTHLAPSNVLGVLVAHLFPGLWGSIEGDARHLPKPEPSATLLDIGCGSGAFLEIAKALNWKAFGIEPDHQAVEVCRARGLLVMQGDVGSLEGQAECYDAITLSHVIEHTHSPQHLLRACLRLLKPGGMLWIDTPNLESKGHTNYGRHWRGLEPPRHLVIFTWDSLRTLLAEVGFETITPLPAVPLAHSTFLASEAIARGEDPYAFPRKPSRTMVRAWWADREGKRNPSYREFITLSATKPVALQRKLD